MLSSSVRRLHRGCVLLSEKGLSPYAYLTPLRSPRRSLWSNDISDQAKQAVLDAAGNGVSIDMHL